MRKILPFIFPLMALLIVLFLLYRWYGLRTNRQGRINTDDSRIQVEELNSSATPGARISPRPGIADMKSIELQPEASPSAQIFAQAQGSIRYEITGDEVYMNVFADLPSLTTGDYQVWWQANNTLVKAFTLVAEKGGHMGAMTFDLGRLPVEVIVSYEVKDDDVLEQTVLKARFEKP